MLDAGYTIGRMPSAQTRAVTESQSLTWPALAALLVVLFVGLSALLGLAPQLLTGSVMAVITALSTLAGG